MSLSPFPVTNAVPPRQPSSVILQVSVSTSPPPESPPVLFPGLGYTILSTQFLFPWEHLSLNCNCQFVGLLSRLIWASHRLGLCLVYLTGVPTTGTVCGTKNVFNMLGEQGGDLLKRLSVLYPNWVSSYTGVPICQISSNYTLRVLFYFMHIIPQ